MKPFQTKQEAFWGGARDFLPIILGVLPFGVVYGLAVNVAGMTLIEGIGMSVLVLGGAAQIVALDLLNTGAAAWIVIISGAIVNIRFVIYSASLAPFFKPFPTRWKILLGYLLTDQPYALSITYFNEYPDAPFKRWYHLGHGLTLWLTWMSASAFGILTGEIIPEDWTLNFAIPLMFIALVAPTVQSRSLLLAGIVSAVVAVMAFDLPSSLGLVVTILAGVVAGMLFDDEKKEPA